ncbi:hypothetical protein BGW39_003518 [Mortierella sp. 14UC]|nr:hypothetical protein BGW39_003518 [Mortierella sp. 14UC]
MNALVSYASDSDSDSDSGEGHSTPPVLKSTALPTSLSATSAGTTPSTAHTPEDSPGEAQARTPQEQEKTKTSNEAQEQQEQQGTGDEDDFVSAALKDLQSFAASIDSTPQNYDDEPTVTEPTATSPSTFINDPPSSTPGTLPPQDLGHSEPTAMDIDQQQPSNTTLEPEQPTTPAPIELSTDQQIIFDTFLQEIDAIPLTNLDQTYPPGYSSPHDTTSNSDNDDEHWIQAQTPQTLYSRIHQLSTLPQSEKFNPKEVENRLIEFAIRLLDWEQGGLRQAYFLGEKRAQAVLGQIEVVERRRARRREERERRDSRSGDESSDNDEDEDEDDEGYEDEKQKDDETRSLGLLPAYGGVVGEMIEFMRATEQIALPDHWTVSWSVKDLSYMFRHAATFV